MIGQSEEGPRASRASASNLISVGLAVRGILIRATGDTSRMAGYSPENKRVSGLFSVTTDSAPLSPARNLSRDHVAKSWLVRETGHLPDSFQWQFHLMYD